MVFGEVHLVISMRAHAPLLLLLSYLVSPSRADDDWSCKPNVGGKTYDLSSLAGDKWVYRDRETPPTKMVDKLFINLCTPLKDSDDAIAGMEARTSGRPTSSLLVD